LPRWFTIPACTAALLIAGLQAATQSAPAPKSKSGSSGSGAVKLELPPAPVKARPALPEAFAGWVATAPPQIVTDAAQADSTNAAALKEYEFTHAAFATYKRDDETITLRALTFIDTSGAYGAYTFYRQNGWPKEDIGSGATSNHNRVLFWIGETVVDATFSRIGPMSASELRELAGQIPVVQGNKAIAPPILSNLPQPALDKQTTHYALGPASYAGAGGALPPDLVRFDLGAEAVTANYSLTSNSATLTIIDYPTPQIAIAQENKIRNYIKAGSHAQPAFPKPLQDSDQASLEVHRSGPLVILVSGDAIPDESHKLIQSVHFSEELVNIPQPTDSEVNKTGRLLLGIAELVIVGSSAALLLGFFLGGGRALYRIARGKPASSVYEYEFIRLNLEK